MKLPVSRFTVNGNSMVPTLYPGQDVLSFNWAYLGKKPKVGDIVVVKVNGKEMAKRVHKVSDRVVYVMGDNQNSSTDSRDFGAVRIDQIVGKVVYKANRHPELDSGSIYMDSRLRGNDNVKNRNDMIECPQCGSPVIGIYGRKDAICRNCGFQLACCGEP